MLVKCNLFFRLREKFMEKIVNFLFSRNKVFIEPNINITIFCSFFSNVKQLLQVPNFHVGNGDPALILRIYTNTPVPPEDLMSSVKYFLDIYCQEETFFVLFTVSITIHKFSRTTFFSIFFCPPLVMISSLDITVNYLTVLKFAVKKTRETIQKYGFCLSSDNFLCPADPAMV